MLIAIEGVDGMGKNTQAKLLCKHLLSERGSVFLPHLVSFPRYDTPIGAIIKKFLTNDYALREYREIEELVTWFTPADRLAEARLLQCLMVVDRLDFAAASRPGLRSGIVRDFVFDRYTMSAIAYGMADGLERDWLYRIHEGLPQADIQILLDGDPAVLLPQRRPQARDRYEANLPKLAKVRENYLAEWKAQASENYRFVIVDASLSVDEVAAKIWEFCCKLRPIC